MISLTALQNQGKVNKVIIKNSINSIAHIYIKHDLTKAAAGDCTEQQ